MFKKWFGLRDHRITEEIIISPLSGKVLTMEEVPDPTFSRTMAGMGIAIDPVEGKVGAPVDGEIIHLFRTKHAVWIRTGSGLDILIHIGLDTVSMNGEGFTTYVETGDRVMKGQPLIDFSLDLVRLKATSPITPMMIIHSDQIEKLEILLPECAEMGITPLMKVKVKS
ncbi:PTS glucose transporter subunit IIA [Paenibacillus sp. sptzw28]|uniref:PTS sugar transporter subunit IIA n=1 Tax=Paenibacillus sp. sptzw28 TaxID=715179 RepID=UPI001C6E525B|nr:PTS glucose transporter subunit IIA [Paenibacillus sp. sptzw28]QYR22380.1 PTS glucose transporter subunit IIA [Paenibacillus sp. sptzw28]